MLFLLFPVGVLTTVALISVSSAFGYLLALVWGCVFLPHGVAYIRSLARVGRGERAQNGSNEDETRYWRMTQLF